jgi:undecaprenyl-diphosphatase
VGWFEAAFLGLVQGLTEFIPVSSSAHLRIVGDLFGWDDPGAAFTAIIQIGTELAVLIYFRKDIVRIIRSWVGSLLHRDRMIIPIIVLGLLLQDQIETTFRDLRIVAIALVLFSLILYAADRMSSGRLELDDLTPKHGLAYGFAQALALIPGVSRSGGTITAGRFLGYSRSAAARYSFLLAIPAVLGSGLYQVQQSLDGGIEWGPTLLATVIAFGVGYVVIAWLLRYLNKGSFTPFVVYRVALGLLILVLVGTGVLDPNSGA